MKRVCVLLICFLASCDRGFQDIDLRVAAMMQEASQNLDAIEPAVQLDVFNNTDPSGGSSTLNTGTDPNPSTVNPKADSLPFIPAEELDVEAIADSLDHAAEDLAASSEILALRDALVWSDEHSREMLFAKYDYLASTLSLLSELHLWGPRFNNTVNTNLTATSADGLYDTSLSVVNDFSITRRLHSGGSVSARALTTIARDLHSATVENDASSALDLTLTIPILKDAGVVARNSLIQAQRNLVYAARTYERFRRTFYREIVGDYLSLVVQKQSLENAQRGVESLKQLADRQAALYASGRARLYDSADAENKALAAVARLSQSWERYRLALDRFKIRIGWSIENQFQVEATSLNVVPPLVDVTDAVISALLYRLDLQNEQDRLSDAHRQVQNAKNAVLPDVNFTATATLAGSDTNPAKFDSKEVDYLTGISVELPLDRETERIAVRQQQIRLERAKRTYRESRDNVAISVRSALRNIELFQFTLDLQEQNVTIAQLGLDSINADPDRVSVLDQTRAISELQSAQDARDSAKRDLELSIVDYLLQAGQLRIAASGELLLAIGNSE